MNYKKGDIIMVKYGKFGEAVILNNGRKNPFNHSEKIYKVQNIHTKQIDSFNQLHFTTIN